MWVGVVADCSLGRIGVAHRTLVALRAVRPGKGGTRPSGSSASPPARASVRFPRDQSRGRVVRPLLVGMLVRGDVSPRLVLPSCHDSFSGTETRVDGPHFAEYHDRTKRSFGGSG